jgi:hypothetical protein
VSRSSAFSLPRGRAAPEPRAGAIASAMRAHEHPALNHRMTATGGVRADDCRGLMQEFLDEMRSGAGVQPDRRVALHRPVPRRQKSRRLRDVYVGNEQPRLAVRLIREQRSVRAHDRRCRR